MNYFKMNMFLYKINLLALRCFSSNLSLSTCRQQEIQDLWTIEAFHKSQVRLPCHVKYSKYDVKTLPISHVEHLGWIMAKIKKFQFHIANPNHSIEILSL